MSTKMVLNYPESKYGDLIRTLLSAMSYVTCRVHLNENPACESYDKCAKKLFS